MELRWCQSEASHVANIRARFITGYCMFYAIECRTTVLNHRSRALAHWHNSLLFAYECCVCVRSVTRFTLGGYAFPAEPCSSYEMRIKERFRRKLYRMPGGDLRGKTRGIVRRNSPGSREKRFSPSVLVMHHWNAIAQNWFGFRYDFWLSCK